MPLALIALALALGLGVYLGRKVSGGGDGGSIFDQPIGQTLEKESDAIDDRKIAQETAQEQAQQASGSVQLDQAQIDLSKKGIGSTREGKTVIPDEKPLTKQEELERWKTWASKNLAGQKKESS